MPGAVATTEQSNPFIKQLASSNRKTRDAALDSLRTYLSRSAPFTELDFLKLWKGLFYSMWLSDKPLNQQLLARDLADLLTVLKGRENFLRFTEAFWKTIAREWAGIDALRMDKYLYLVRCYVNQGFESVSRQDWTDEGLLEQYLRVLESVPLNVTDPKIPNGLRFHVIDLYIDELNKVDTKRNAPLEKILVPLRKLGEDSRTKPIKERVHEALEDERVGDWKVERADDHVSDPTITASADNSLEMDAENEDEFDGFGD